MSSAAFVLAGRQDCPPDPVVHSSQPPMAWPFRLWSVKPSREGFSWFGSVSSTGSWTAASRCSWKRPPFRPLELNGWSSLLSFCKTRIIDCVEGFRSWNNFDISWLVKEGFFRNIFCLKTDLSKPSQGMTDPTPTTQSRKERVNRQRRLFWTNQR